MEVGLEGMKEERSTGRVPSQKRDESVEVPSVWLPQTVFNPLLLFLFPNGSGTATLSLSHTPLKLRVAIRPISGEEGIKQICRGTFGKDILLSD